MVAVLQYLPEDDYCHVEPVRAVRPFPTARVDPVAFSQEHPPSSGSSPSAPSPSDAQPSRSRLLAAARHRRGTRLGHRADGGACGRCARGFHHHRPRAQPACHNRRRASRRHALVDRRTGSHRTPIRGSGRRDRRRTAASDVRPGDVVHVVEVMGRHASGNRCVADRIARAVSWACVSWGDVASARSSSGARPPRARSRRDPRSPCIPTRSGGTRRDRDRVAARAR